MSLNEIVENLCDWIHDNKLNLRYLNVYSEDGGVYVRISLGKIWKCKPIAITKEFYLGGCIGSEQWKAYGNDLKLNSMIEELNEYHGI